MTYTELTVVGVLIVTALDLYFFKTKILKRRVFWASYAIVFFFQLVTNGILTGFGIVEYDGNAIIGSGTPQSSPPTFIGDGRLAFAPIEDLLFGFCLVVLTLIIWVWLGRIGVQREPKAGPPRTSVERFLGTK
jgi:lycopene cyclase domain-containing protein